MTRPLICLPSPRDYPSIKAAVDLLPADKLWAKYYTPSINAYLILQREFLASDYTHFVMLPDDLLVTLDTWRKFVTDIETYPDEIITGYCNVDRTIYQKFANISLFPVSGERQGRAYRWMTLDGIWEDAAAHRKLNPDKHEGLPEYIIDIQFAGFPLMAIPRKIVQEIEFRNDSPSGRDASGCCLDATFCHDALKAGYRILCDIRLRSEHLKVDDNRLEYFYAGIKQPLFKYDFYKVINL